MKQLTIYILLLITCIGCQSSDDYPEDEFILFDVKDTADIPYTGGEELEFVRWDMSDTTIYDTITLIVQEREIYNRHIVDKWKGESSYGVWGESLIIHFDAYTSYRRKDFDITFEYFVEEYETKIEIRNKVDRFQTYYPGYSSCSVTDTVINGQLYNSLAKYGKDGCTSYMSGNNGERKLTIYYNIKEGIIRLIDYERDMIWELIP